MVTIEKNANHSQKLFPATVFTNYTDDKLKIKVQSVVLSTSYIRLL